MSRFVRWEIHDPFVTFATTLRRLRPAVERAFYAAYAASDASNDAMRLYQMETFEEPLVPEILGGAFPKIEKTGMDPEMLYANAIAEDSHCDMQAVIVVLFADDLLQRFGQKVLGRKIVLGAYGPEYRGVSLTTLLRATTNGIRHVSEWEDLPFPYPELKDTANTEERRAIQNIEILQKAYGIGRHERIRDFVSWNTVSTIEGLYGSSPPSYKRFEDALVEGARDMARHAGEDQLTHLEQVLSGNANEQI